MANAFYPDWKQEMLQATASAGLAHGSGAAVTLIDTGAYTYSTAHDFYNDLSGTYGDGGTARANAELLASKTYVDGTLDAADTVFAGVDTGGTTVEGFVIFINDNLADATSRLCAFWDASITGMPFSTSSPAQVTIAWNAAGILDL